MVALTDLIDLCRSRGATALEFPYGSNETQHHPAKILTMCSGGFDAWAATAPSVGEAIRIHIPAVGLVDARVTWRAGRQFGAEFCGATQLRLLFLRGSCVGCSSWFLWPAG